MEKISIVIPTYKRPDLLDRLLKSISQQTYRNYEIIIVDDNSPNEEKYYELIKRYSKIFDELVYLKNNYNRGAPYSRNRGINLSKYNLIALVDDDDEWLPNKLEKQSKIFSKSDSNLGLVYTWTDVIDDDGNLVYKYRPMIEGNPVREILKKCFIPSPSVIVKKKAIKSAGLFDEKLPSCQDWDMWTRIFERGYTCKVVDSVQTIYHKHNGESIGNSTNAKLGYKLYYRKHLPLYINLFIKNYDFVEIIRALKGAMIY